jgi:organic radical activating enzyme
MKQYHIEQEVQRLNIHWDIITVCQYNCTYCYARKEYGEIGGWNKIPKLADQKKVVDAISSSSLPYNLGLLGGEPTIHIHYKELIEYIHSKLRESDRLYVVSNGKGDFSKHPVLEKLVILWSYHPEYVDEEELLKNVQVMIDKGYQYKINIMLHPGRKYWESTKKFIMYCYDKGMRIHPHFLYKDVYTLYSYSKDFWKFFEFLEFVTDKDLVFGDTLHNDFSLFKGKYNRFKGWNCYNNNYEVSVDYKVNKFCKDNNEVNVLQNPSYFKDIKEIEHMTCPFSSCNCDGLLKMYKETKDDSLL